MQQLLWWIAALVWVVVSGLLFSFADYHHYGALFGFTPLMMVVIPMILAFHVPPGLFRSVRTGPVAAKIGLGLLLMVVGGVGMALIFTGIMSQVGIY
ncbi:MAG: hypothetical protein IKQ91_08150 [Oscillospiraceae bacterium]|nr:hypothetical protein [Oscillospiraceae bacterium]